MSDNSRWEGGDAPHPQEGGKKHPEHSPYSPPDSRYLEIRKNYQAVSRRSTIIQGIGLFFAVITFIIELFIYRLAKRLLGTIERFHILRFIGIFVILFAISCLAVGQLVVIARWNHQSQLDQNSNLAVSHYRILNHIRLIQVLISFTIVLAVYFLIIYRNYIQIPPATPFPIIMRLYHSLLRTSALLCLVYLIFEVGQLYIWSKRLRAIHRIESRLQSELPNLDELSRLLDDNASR